MKIFTVAFRLKQKLTCLHPTLSLTYSNAPILLFQSGTYTLKRALKFWAGIQSPHPLHMEDNFE